MSAGETRFAVINDLHAQFAPAATAEAGYAGANGRAEWLLRQFEPGGSLADVAFVVGAGDLVHGENLPAIRTELAALAARVQRLPVPFYPCCGNHEIEQREGDAAWEAPYRAAFGDDRFDYAIEAGPAQVIVLNNGGTFHVTAARREQRYHALTRLLSVEPSRPKILICHVPLVPVRERAVLRESFGFRTHTSLEAELLDVLEVHGAAVRLILSGHLHLTGAADWGRARQVVTAGSASWPHDFAVVTVRESGCTVDVCSLPAELHEPATNIHGPPRYARSFTDTTHPTPLAYVRGRDDERRMTLAW